MGVFGTQMNNMLTIGNGTAEEYVFEDYVSSEKRLIIVPETDAVLHLLLTTAGNESDADAEDLLIPASGLNLEVGRSIDRVSIYNASGSEKKAYISILF